MEITKEPIVVGDRPEEPDIEEYRTLAKSAGWSEPDVETAIEIVKQPVVVYEFRRFLAQNGICIYDTSAVQKYMYRVVRRLNWRRFWQHKTRLRWWWCPLNSSTSVIGYRLPIPTPVLLTIKTIRDQFPLCTFYVTEMADINADPFLRVDYQGESFIIERWDEPGFRL